MNLSPQEIYYNTESSDELYDDILPDETFSRRSFVEVPAAGPVSSQIVDQIHIQESKILQLL